VIQFPTIEVVPPRSQEPLDASIGRLGEYDCVVFTSANGVDFFFRRLNSLGGNGAALAGCVVCAIGPATARALDELGTRPNVTASDSKAEGALTAIIDYLGGDASVKGKRFLIPRAQMARETLPDGLRRLGGFVDAVEAYRTVKPAVERESIVRIVEQNAIDVVTFTSSSTVSNFAEIVGLKDLSGFLSATLVACVGPITAATAASYGLRKIIQPQLYNADALIESIVEALGRE
jgi:uroporphyrinogen III methyltransferase/synthase